MKKSQILHDYTITVRNMSVGGVGKAKVSLYNTPKWRELHFY